MKARSWKNAQLYSNPALGAFRRAAYGFTDAMVHVSTKAPFPPAALLEQPLRRFGALFLELLPQAREAGTHLIDRRMPEMLGASRMVQKLAVRSRRQSNHAQVY